MAITSFEPHEEEYMSSSREKRPISQHLGIYLTNMDTLLSQPFKVEEKKVSLLFLCMAQEPGYWHFVHLTISRTSLPKFQ